jgi:hypothetical protein
VAFGAVNYSKEMGNIMNEIELDALANWVIHLKQLKQDRAEIDEQIEVAEGHIKDALGEVEIGTIGGEPVVRWTYITSNRFDQKAAKALLTDDQVEACTNESVSRRFTIVEG